MINMINCTHTYRKLALIALIIFCLPLLAYSQTGWKMPAHTWGGAGSDYADSVAMDSQGNAYVAGATSSVGAGGSDVLLLKYDPVGNLLWAKTWGGASDEYATSVAVGPDGSIYITGGTSSFGSGWFDFFLLKLDTGGNLQWATTWGGGSYDVGHDIGFDASGNIYVAGETYSFGPCCSSAVLIKFSPSGGSPIWTRTWKGPATYDGAYSLTVDSQGSVIVSGISWDYSVFPLHNSLLLIKYDSAGNFLWSENWNSPIPADDESWSFKALTTDSTGNIYVGGRHTNQCLTDDFSQCDFDAFVMRLDSGGNFLWARTWGEPGYDTPASVAIDPTGHLLVSGIDDVFGTPLLSVLTYDTAGNLLSRTAWSTQAIVPGSAQAGMALDPLGNVFVVSAASNNSGAWSSIPANATPMTNSLVSNPFSLGSPVGSVALFTTPPTVSQTGVGDTGGGGMDVLVTPLTLSPPPLAQFAPSSLDFGNIPVGSTSDLSLVVTNVGGGMLAGTASAASPFSIIAGSPFALASGQSQTIAARFSPVAAVGSTRFVALSSNGGSGSINVTGTGFVSKRLAVGQVTVNGVPLAGVPVLRLNGNRSGSKFLQLEERAFTDINGNYFFTQLAQQDYVMPVSSGVAGEPNDPNTGPQGYIFSPVFCQIGVIGRECGTNGQTLTQVFTGSLKPGTSSPVITFKLPVPSGNWTIVTEAGGYAITKDQIDGDPSHTDLSSGFYAIDIAGPCGTPILAPADGVVVLAVNDVSAGWGWTIVVQHEGGIYTRYAHLDSIIVKKGDSVTQGQVLGLMGSTGASLGAHLHFQFYDGGFTSAQSQSNDPILGRIRLETGGGSNSIIDLIAGLTYQSTNISAAQVISCSK